MGGLLRPACRGLWLKIRYGSLRIGEASNPGPQRAFDDPDFEVPMDGDMDTFPVDDPDVDPMQCREYLSSSCIRSYFSRASPALARVA